MSELTELEAIKRVIGEGGAMDYVDVVEAVEKRFRIKTSSAVVEQVHREMMQSRADSKQIPKPRVSFEMAAGLVGDEGANDPAAESSAKTHPGAGGGSGRAESSADALSLALQYVKAVGGMKKARRALDELEAILRD